jgi:hypothetical protein
VPDAESFGGAAKMVGFEGCGRKEKLAQQLEASIADCLPMRALTH